MTTSGRWALYLLLALPGVGPYAAGAVRALGHGRPAAIVDGPVGRFYRRFAGLPDTGRSPYYDERAWEVAAMLVPRSARPYYYALIDLVAAHCLPRRPRCSTCPVESLCAFALGGRAA